LRLIQTKGYNKKEKKIIGEKYLLPRILKEYNINELTLTEDSWNYVLNDRDEPGVRNLKRDLETVVSRLNIHRLLKGEQAIKGVPSDIKWNGDAVKELVEDDVKTLLGNRDDGKNRPPFGMYC
jgi:ATP-dependent Lon protease